MDWVVALRTYAAHALHARTRGGDGDVITQGDRAAAVQAVGLVLAQWALAFDGAVDVPRGKRIADEPGAIADTPMRAAGFDGAQDLPGTTFEFAGKLAGGVLHMEQAPQTSALRLGKFDGHRLSSSVKDCLRSIILVHRG